MAAGVVMAEVAEVAEVAVTDYPIQFYHQVHIKTFASFPKIYIYPRLRHFKPQGGLSQANQPSKLERKGRQESHRQ